MATVVEVGADDGEVAVDDAEDVAGLARPGHRHRLPGGDRDRAVAGVAGGRGHLAGRRASKARPGSCTASAASPCTCAWVGITATRTPCVGLGGAGRDLGDAHGVGVVGQHHDLGAHRSR